MVWTLYRHQESVNFNTHGVEFNTPVFSVYGWCEGARKSLKQWRNRFMAPIRHPNQYLTTAHPNSKMSLLMITTCRHPHCRKTSSLRCAHKWGCGKRNSTEMDVDVNEKYIPDHVRTLI